MSRDITYYHTSASNNRTFAHRDAIHQNRTRPNPCIIFDYYTVLAL